MLDWFANNLATVILSSLLAAVLFLIVSSMIRNKKKGKSSCGCGCESCGMKGDCHPK